MSVKRSIIDVMNTNKTQPTKQPVDDFLDNVGEARRGEARILIEKISNITGLQPVMWGPSIIGFGQQHYKYASGRQGEMPMLSFSPRKTNITIYFSEGFEDYASELLALGKHKQSVSCLYIPQLKGIDMNILEEMLQKSWSQIKQIRKKPTTVDEYIENIPIASRKAFHELRAIVKATIPDAEEVLSYGIVGYKVHKKTKVFISGWKDHVALYPVPKDASVQKKLKKYIKSKGSMWFALDQPLPRVLIVEAVISLADFPG